MNTPDLSSLRILVVDDEPDTLEVVRLVLSSVGAEVYEANNGQEAFDLFQQQDFDVVLTDLSMPQVDGWQLLESIRSHPDGQHIPVIALTAHAMVGDRERVLEAGFTGYMKKPLKMFTFLQDLEECLGQMSP